MPDIFASPAHSFCWPAVQPFLNPSVASAQQINSDIPASSIQSNARLVITQAALVLYLALIERDVQTVANSTEPYHSVLA